MNSRKPSLIVTIDTECDKTANWHTAKPLSFTAVTQAIPRRLQPLFARTGIRPTYFLSPEVMADRESAAVLRSLHNCELATHLHGDYILPKIKTWDFAEAITSDMQWEYPPDLERAKLAALTEMFVQQFDCSPKSFRAGRFGIGPNSGRWLRELGYLVDSSVTPHLCWTSPKGEPKPDFRVSPERPYTISPDGDIWSAGNSNFLEVPITILAPGTVPANNPRDPIWFRPWYSDAATLCNVLRHVASQAPEDGVHRPLVMMFHNVELVAGASPYPQTEADVQRYLDALERVFDLAAKLGIESCTLAEFYQKYARSEPQLNRAPEHAAVALASRLPVAPGLDLSAEMVEAALDRYEVQPWFKHAFRDRAGRWDCWRPCVWVFRNCSKDAPVLSLGSGVGYNLMWLAEHGFSDLHGFDIDARAIAAGKEIAQRADLSVNLWVDDALHPQQMPTREFAVIEALCWTHLLKGFSLPELLELYVPHLAENGVFIVDMIDADFNDLPNNQYHTQDWEKPVAERRPSEYKTRLSEQQMREMFLSKGLQLAEVIREPQRVPKAVYVARRQAVSKLVGPPSALPASTNDGSKAKDKPLSVCFFAHSSQLAGAERSLLELVRELVSDHGAQCTIVIPGVGPLDQALQRAGATTIQASYPWWCESPAANPGNGTERLKSGLVTMLRSVVPALKHINADIFVTHSLVVPWGAVAASLFGRPHVWSICEYGERDFHFFLPFDAVTKEVAASSEFVFTATEGIRRTLFPQLSNERCRTLYRHIPIPSSTPGQTDSGTYVCAGAIRLGVFGTLTENKGQEDAVRAMGLLVAAGRNVELVLAGAADPAYRASIGAMIRELGIQDRVHLTGFIADPYPLMNEADILMVCTRSEGFGRTAVEGMLLGKPVIYAAAGGFLEYMVDGRTGLSYPCCDYAALANRIALLIDQPGERTRLGAEARAHATAKFSPDAYGGEVFRTIKSIVARQAPPARLSAELQRLVGSALSEIIDQPDRHEPARDLAPIAVEEAMPLEDEFDEKAYLALHHDVAQAVKHARCKSGWSHFVSSGFREKRQWFRRGSCNGLVSAIPRTELPEGMDQLQRGWDLLGKVDPLWAILSDPKKKNHGWKTDEFFRSGEGTIAQAVQEARRLQPALRLGRALDFGCGVGRLTQALCQHFQEAHGVDIAPSMIEQAKSYNRHGTRCQYHLNSATNLRLFPDRHFDFVYSLIVLQHIRPEFSRRYVQEFVRVLAFGGVLIFQIPGEQNRYLTGPRSHPELGANDQVFVAEPERLIEMHGLPRAEVITLLEQQGATILDIRADSEAGKDAESYTYFATRK